jgi:hypothetical protein
MGFLFTHPLYGKEVGFGIDLERRNDLFSLDLSSYYFTEAANFPLGGERDRD